MRRRVCWVVGLFIVLRCATSIAVHPSREHPVPMCVISCGRGGRLMFERQHLCAGGGSRFFADVIAIGERTERNEDGTLKSDVWVTIEGDYPKVNVETMTCSAYVDLMRSTRSSEQNGSFPGETPDGHPAPH